MYHCYQVCSSSAYCLNQHGIQQWCWLAERNLSQIYMKDLLSMTVRHFGLSAEVSGLVCAYGSKDCVFSRLWDSVIWEQCALLVGNLLCADLAGVLLELDPADLQYLVHHVLLLAAQRNREECHHLGDPGTHRGSNCRCNHIVSLYLRLS